jgi:hypothetical protein
MLNRLVHRYEEKNVMVNDIAGLGGLIFLSVILRKIIDKFAIGFGKFMRILKDQWKC